MIKLVDEALIGRYLSYCADKPFGIRMAAALMSYGTDCEFADFWLVFYDDKIIGAISKLDGDLTLCADEASEEVFTFISTVGYQTLTAEKELLCALGFDGFSGEGAIMLYAGDGFLEVNPIVDTSPSIMSVCKILCECEGESIKVGQFDRFYTDLALRVRRNTAVCYAIGNKGVAIASAVTANGSIIGGVAVRQSERKNGIGSALVRKLVSDLPNDKKIYLLRLENENENFYKKLGFKNTGSWASISRGCELNGAF